MKTVLMSATAAVVLTGCAYDGYDRYGDRYYGDPGPGPGYRAARYDGCSDNAAIGTVGGAIVGGVIGNQFGSGSGRTAATIGGAILGGIAGNAIARDACRDQRYDAYYYNPVYYDAFDGPEYGRRYSWRNPHSGRYGYVTPVRRMDGGRWGYRGDCEEFRHTVYTDDQPYEEIRVACLTDDGTWRIVASN